jgi:hypothetical protein
MKYIIIIILFILAGCEDDVKFHTTLYAYPGYGNYPIITNIKNDGVIDYYTVRTHGTIYTFFTYVVDSTGKYKIGDTLKISKK